MGPRAVGDVRRRKVDAVNTNDREWLHDHQHTPSLLYKPMLINYGEVSLALKWDVEH